MRRGAWGKCNRSMYIGVFMLHLCICVSDSIEKRMQHMQMCISMKHACCM